jgi:hypothetical protein
MSLPWDTLLATICLVGVVLVSASAVLWMWLNGRRKRRKTPVRPARRRFEPERHPVPSRDPMPTSQDHDLVEEFLRTLDRE